MSNGALIDGTGNVVAIVYGYTSGAQAGQTFVAYPDTSVLTVGQVPPAPPTSADLTLASTDYQMSRGLEDLVATLITKGTIAGTDLPAPLLTKINARRALRGQGTL